jgi:hypothetical protein
VWFLGGALSQPISEIRFTGTTKRGNRNKRQAMAGRCEPCEVIMICRSGARLTDIQWKVGIIIIIIIIIIFATE